MEDISKTHEPDVGGFVGSQPGIIFKETLGKRVIQRYDRVPTERVVLDSMQGTEAGIKSEPEKIQLRRNFSWIFPMRKSEKHTQEFIREKVTFKIHYLQYVPMSYHICTSKIRPCLDSCIISSILFTAIKLEDWKPWLENGTEVCGKGVSTKKRGKKKLIRPFLQHCRLPRLKLYQDGGGEKIQLQKMFRGFFFFY